MSHDELEQEGHERLHRFLDESAHHPVPDGFVSRVAPRPRWFGPAGRSFGTVMAFTAVAAVMTILLVSTAGTAGSRRAAVEPTSGQPITASTSLVPQSAYEDTSYAQSNAIVRITADRSSLTVVPIAPSPYPGVNPSPSAAPVTLGSVTCPAAGDCWAVGGGDESFGGIVEHYDGITWSAVGQPASGVIAGFVSVSCARADDCWAVGSTTGDIPEPALEHYSDGAWSSVQGPELSAGALSGVSCPDSSHCWAVGSVFAPTGGSQEPLLEAYDGSGWSVVSNAANLPAGEVEGATLNAIACVGEDDCWAVGSDTGGELIEHYDGTRWTVSPGPAVPRGAPALLAISCAGTSACWAVGGDLMEHYDGTGWTLVSGAPSSAGSPGLVSVTCVGAGDCWAVGSLNTVVPGQIPTTSAVVEWWDGTAWTRLSWSSRLAGLRLQGVACTGSGTCWAVGAVVGWESP
ncbi:MAG: hypothetical protein ABR950_04305 [Candidatus Dormibacteria bacterium]|jgi:hypothetical protein